MKRVFTTFMVLVMLLSLSMHGIAAQVEDNIVSPKYTYIQKNTVNLSINENTGIATCKANCYTLGTYTVEVECRLQRLTGSMWTTIQTWSASGTSYAGVNKNWAVYSGYTYRAYALYSVRDSAGNLLESDTGSYIYVFPSNT